MKARSAEGSDETEDRWRSRCWAVFSASISSRMVVEGISFFYTMDTGLRRAPGLSLRRGGTP